jgi:hypothetical protein
LETERLLNPDLANLGMTDMFDRNYANFSGILNQPSNGIFVSKVRLG